MSLFKSFDSLVGSPCKRTLYKSLFFWELVWRIGNHGLRKGKTIEKDHEVMFFHWQMRTWKEQQIGLPGRGVFWRNSEAVSRLSNGFGRDTLYLHALAQSDISKSRASLHFYSCDPPYLWKCVGYWRARQMAAHCTELWLRPVAHEIPLFMAVRSHKVVFGYLNCERNGLSSCEIRVRCKLPRRVILLPWWIWWMMNRLKCSRISQVEHYKKNRIKNHSRSLSLLETVCGRIIELFTVTGSYFRYVIFSNWLLVIVYEQLIRMIHL